MGLFGERPKPKKRATPVGYQSTDLGARLGGAAAGGGGIQPGAHPEYENIKPGLRNPFEDLYKHFFAPKKKAVK